MKFSSGIQRKELTKKQNSIVVSNEYPQYLRAGAGTGKTEVLVRKIVNILEQDASVSLSNFAIITFTNKASDEMKQRISGLLYSNWVKSKDKRYVSELDAINMADISTIHSFCERMLRRFGLQIDIAPNFSVKSFKRESNEIVSRLVAEQYGNAILEPISSGALVRSIMLLLNDNGNRGITISEELLKNLLIPVDNNGYWNEFKKLFLNLYCRAEQEIEQKKAEMNVLSPNDLIKYAARLLSNDYVAKKVSDKFRYVFIDEFQDTNSDQFELVKLLIDNGVKVFLVGDDKQSIYAFRGADVQNSQDMHSMIKHINRKRSNEYLDENFRSTPEVIKVINEIFSSKFNYNGQQLNFPKEPLDIPRGKGKTGISPLSIKFEKSVTEIVQDIIANTKINGRLAEYGDIAVLCRRNYDLDKISKELKEAGVPTYVVGGKGFYRAKEIVDVYKVLNAAVNTDIACRNELVFTDFNCSTDMLTGLVDEIAQILRSETVEDTLIHLYEKSRIFDYYRAGKNYQAISNLLKLKDIARGLIDRDNTQPLQFVEYLATMISTNQEEDEAEIPEVDRRSGVVTLYSIHKAKGLSFPIVVIPNCDSKLNRPITKPKIIFDSRAEKPAIGFDSEMFSDELPPDAEYLRMYEGNIAEQLEEEIRVFYVACTRAKYQIILSCDNKQDKVQQTVYYRDYASVIRWLLEMDNGAFVRKHIN